MLAQHLPESKVVKAFNAIMMPHLDRDGQPAGSFDRRALPLAGDDVAAKNIVAELHEQFGFDPVDVRALSAGHSGILHRFNRDWIERALAEAR